MFEMFERKSGDYKIYGEEVDGKYVYYYPDYEKMIVDACIDCNLSKNEPVWDMMNEIIEFALRDSCTSLLGGLEPICEAVEDYCIYQNIQHIPDLYKYIFKSRGGFLTQSKAIKRLYTDWIKLFPDQYISQRRRDSNFEIYIQKNYIDDEVINHC